MLERSAGGDSASSGALERDRVGAVGGTDRPMPLYTPGRAPVTYGPGTIWVVVAILAVLFAVFFGWVLFLR